MQKSTFYLPDDLQAEFELVAKRLEKSRAEIIRELIQTYVNEQRPAKPRSRGKTPASTRALRKSNIAGS